MAKDMLDAIYNAEEDCRQREANARAESNERVEQTKADAKQVVLSARKGTEGCRYVLKRLRKRAKELENASEKANLECDILSQTADKTASVLLTGLYSVSL